MPKPKYTKISPKPQPQGDDPSLEHSWGEWPDDRMRRPSLEKRWHLVFPEELAGVEQLFERHPPKAGGGAKDVIANPSMLFRQLTSDCIRTPD
jgi:hypothetical protein